MPSSESVLNDYKKKHDVETLEDVTPNVSSLSALDTMFQEVLSDLLPRHNDYEHRRTLVNTIGELVKNNFGSSNNIPIVEAFGSFTMDMFTAGSDLDLSVKLSTDKDLASPRSEHILFLRKFAKVLYEYQNKGVVRHVQPILSARVPIVKFVDSVTGVECDISVENNDGVLKSLIIFLISSIDDRFRNLTFLLKAWAKAHNINSSRDHTLNSLSVTLLVIIHLQNRDPPILPPLSAILEGGKDPSKLKENVQRFKDFGQANKETVAELFLCFFNKLLSLRYFWRSGLCASTFDGLWIYREPAGPLVDEINVEDFIHRSENCARAVNKKKFQLIYQCIRTTRKRLLHFNKAEIEASQLKILLFGPADARQKEKDLAPKNKRPKKIKLGKRKKLRLLGLAKAGTKVSQPGSSNWDALVDQQKSPTKTGDHWERISEGAVSSKRKQLPGSVEPVASTIANTATFHSAIPPSWTNLNMGREDHPQKKPGLTGIHVAGELDPSVSFGTVSNGPDLMKKARHSNIQSGVAQHQQNCLYFYCHRPPVLPHQQQGLVWQNQLLPPRLPHELFNDLQRQLRHASGLHQSFPMERPYPQIPATGLQQPHPRLPLSPGNISLPQIHYHDLAPYLGGGLQQPHLQPHSIGMQQLHPNPAHPLSHPQFGNPSYRLPHNWHPSDPLVHPPIPASHDPYMFPQLNAQNQLYRPPNPVSRRP